MLGTYLEKKKDFLLLFLLQCILKFKVLNLLLTFQKELRITRQILLKLGMGNMFIGLPFSSTSYGTVSKGRVKTEQYQRAQWLKYEGSELIKNVQKTSKKKGNI